MQGIAESTEELLRPLVLPKPRCVGIASALVKGGAIIFRAFGESGDPEKVLDERAIFDVGSITKVFTGVLLSEMTQQGNVGLDDPLAAYLPQGTKIPRQDDREIRLVDLATHTSGLPRLPPNLRSSERFDPQDPYAHFDKDQLLDGLAASSIEGQIGSTYRYSNFGFELLAHALGRADASSYSDLLSSRVLQPLGLEDTSVWEPKRLAARLVPGHSDMADRVAFWSTLVPGDGGVISSAQDMARFLLTNLEGGSPLDWALAEARRNHLPDGSVTAQGLGWAIAEDKPGVRYHWHNGGSGGYGSFMALEAEKRVGVVLLANSPHSALIDSAGVNLLDRLCEE